MCEVDRRRNHSCRTSPCERVFVIRFDRATMNSFSVMRAFLQLMLLSMPGIHARSPERPITCDAGPYAPDQPAFITCNLHEIMPLTDDVVVILVRYPSNSTKDVPGKEIMTCKQHEGGRKPQCNIKRDGYMLVNASLERPTVMIPSVKIEFAGLYMCYAMPPKETTSHGCRLTVKADWNGNLPGSGTSDSLHETTTTDCENCLKWALPLLTILAGALVVLLFVFVRTVRALRRRRQDAHALSELAALYTPTHARDLSVNEETIEREIDSEINRRLDKFKLSKDHYNVFMKHLNNELHPTQVGERTIKMISTRIPSLPTGKERAEVVVVDFGSTVLKILLINLHDPSIEVIATDVLFSRTQRQGTGLKLFSFIAECVDDFARAHSLLRRHLPLALVLSFPFEQGRDLSKATLTTWTKEFDCKDVERSEIGNILHSSMKRQNPTLTFDVKVIVNDSVGTLVSAAFKEPSCRIAVILSDGFNVCYMEDQGNTKEKVFVNTGLGSLGYDGCLNMLRTPFDKTIDEASANNGEQILEKMISWLYTGEIVRRVLLKLAMEKLLFKSSDSAIPALSKSDGFAPDFFSLIESDTDEHYVGTRAVLRLLGVHNYMDEDMKTVHFVCQIISERAAFLVAAVLGTLINCIGEHGKDITIAVNGSLYHSHHRFLEKVQSKMQELVKEEFKETFKLISVEHGRAIGAALIAATLTS